MNKDGFGKGFSGKGTVITQPGDKLKDRLMNPNVQNEHALETYKSLINISLAGLKLLALLNGGAAVALLAFIGNISGKALSVPDMRWPMGFFLFGLAFCGFAFFTSYWTQFILYQEIMDDKAKQQRCLHIFWHRLALIFALLSLLAFIMGSISAVKGFQNPASYSASQVENQLIKINPKADR